MAFKSPKEQYFKLRQQWLGRHRNASAIAVDVLDGSNMIVTCCANGNIGETHACVRLPKIMRATCTQCGKPHPGDAARCGACDALRDQFAMAALPEVSRQFSSAPTSQLEGIARERKYNGTLPGLVAICAYEQADALLEARK